MNRKDNRLLLLSSKQAVFLGYVIECFGAVDGGLERLVILLYEGELREAAIIL